MIEKISGPTPNGGVYAIVDYLDENNKPCEKKNASIINIKEFDKNDKQLIETWGNTTKRVSPIRILSKDAEPRKI